MCGRGVLADRARLGRPGSRLPLHASVAGLGGGISWRPPAYPNYYLLLLLLLLLLSLTLSPRRHKPVYRLASCLHLQSRSRDSTAKSQQIQQNRKDMSEDVDQLLFAVLLLLCKVRQCQHPKTGVLRPVSNNTSLLTQASRMVIVCTV